MVILLMVDHMEIMGNKYIKMGKNILVHLEMV
jgi:hypothetical protein